MKWISTIAIFTAAFCVATMLPDKIQAAGNPSLETKVDSLLKNMTLDEKLDLLTGTGFSTHAVPRLGIPAANMSDGPQGVSGGTIYTSFPAGICMASTWNPSLINTLGAAIARETIGKEGGGDIVLGPCINIHRTPFGGRNCESFSEDPYLAGKIAVGYIKGVQSQGAAACVKHYACNNQEYERTTINVKVSERALREIYLPAFYAATRQANAWSLMTSYNCINGLHGSANKHLITDILKNEWGWDGLVMSDWGGAHETAAVLNSGNDLEMPGGLYLTREKLHQAIDNGEIKLNTVDESAKRVLRCIARIGLLDGPKKRDSSVLNCTAHRQIAQKVASEGVVLLKNNNDVLPIDMGKVKSIALIGQYAATLQSSVRGSGNVAPANPVSPLDGIKKQVGNSIQINYAEGIRPASDDKNANSIKEAADAAAKSDVAVIFAGINGDYEGEGLDRAGFDLPEGQNELIKAVSAANKKTVVVMFGATTSDLTKWVNDVPALLQAWYPGVMGGNAIADILFGNVNPSGKLPDTFGRLRSDYPDYGNYPGANSEVKYEEGIFVGYRHFDKANIKPLFPFGHGLSYTTFKYSNMKFDTTKMHRGGKVKVSMTLTNTGKRAGAEVVQLYVSELHPTVERPVRELKGFEKVFLNPGQSKVVSFNIDESALSFYSVANKKWVANAGKYEISIGSSSRDLRLKKILELK